MSKVTDNMIIQMSKDGVGLIPVIKLVRALDSTTLADAKRRIDKLNLEWNRTSGPAHRGDFSKTFKDLMNVDDGQMAKHSGRLVFNQVCRMSEKEKEGFIEAFNEFKAQFEQTEKVFNLLSGKWE